MMAQLMVCWDQQWLFEEESGVWFKSRYPGGNVM